MRTQDLLQEAYGALHVNKARSGLTMLGIVIGIASVIAMVAIGEGAKQSVQERIQSIGSNLISVSPGSQRSFGHATSGRGSAQTLTYDDSEAIRTEVSGIKAVAPEVTRSYQITTPGKNTNTQVVGTLVDYQSVRTIKMKSGSFLAAQHHRSGSKVAVLGPVTSADLFGEGSDPVSRKVRIKGIDFTVIGVTEERGSSGFSNNDDIVFVPLSTAQRFLSGDEFLSRISIQAQDEGQMATIQENITALLLQRHRKATPEEADFSVQNQADILETASAITGTFTMLLASIAAISLIVGGIGIMNMMLTSVTERTREIGLRKAIGAKGREISLQFLTESVMLTFIGGIVGIILGWAIAAGVSRLAGLNTTVSLSSVALAFVVSAAIGIIFGYYPARRAAALNPIEALRHE